MPERPQISHKGTFGRVLNVSGSEFMTGAPYLSSIAALRTGCGYLVLCTEKQVINALSAQTPDIVFAPIESLIEQIEKADVVLIGCGLSQTDETKKIFNTLLNNIKEDKPLVIDADGLNILAQANIKLPKNVVLTPHPQEASRLLDVETSEITKNPEYYAKEISKKYGCVTVLKGHNTVVCSKDSEIYVNNTGNSCLAKAGSGDVLAGIIAGLLAQKCDIFYAAKLGVYLHGLCGDIAKNDLSEYGVLASDLLRYIPKAINNLL